MTSFNFTPRNYVYKAAIAAAPRHVLVDEQSITRRTRSGRTRIMYFRDVEKVRFSEIVQHDTHYFALVLQGGGERFTLTSSLEDDHAATYLRAVCDCLKQLHLARPDLDVQLGAGFSYRLMLSCIGIFTLGIGGGFFLMASISDLSAMARLSSALMGLGSVFSGASLIASFNPLRKLPGCRLPELVKSLETRNGVSAGYKAIKLGDVVAS
ncbi:MAG: hypothetical protein CME88_04155 [Hirschia sp.]|nr:hypothetical protein [Hirschia sp.]MBF17552.1 hypothetical protein [Hirschia sp.]|tara:strand:+ start:325 stop:954 length:630 start_codon:yes stop_codon:yes gene_type:complete